MGSGAFLIKIVITKKIIDKRPLGAHKGKAAEKVPEMLKICLKTRSKVEKPCFCWVKYVGTFYLFIKKTRFYRNDQLTFKNVLIFL